MSFAVRRNGVISTFAISSGSLLYLYDPKIYAGDQAALTAFKAKTLVPPSEYKGKVPAAPWGYGLVVLDVDSRRQWDLQIARNLRFLSKEFDWSWQHFTKWRSIGWLGEGLVSPQTGNVVYSFPVAERNIRNWYDGILQDHREAQKNVSVEDFMRNAGTAPAFQISPPGWTFNSFEVEAKGEMLMKLKEAGFTFKEADLKAWSSWRRP